MPTARLFSIAFLALTITIAGCGRAANTVPPRLLVGVSPQAKHDLFPRTRVAVDDDACAASEAPDSTIGYQRVETPSRYLGAVQLRLPWTYLLEPHSLAHRPISEEAAGTRVASWRLAGDEPPTKRVPMVGLWVVPDGGWPKVGAAPGTQQISWTECRRLGRNGARVAMFTLVTGQDSTAYLVAVWRAYRGRYLQLLASAPRIAELAPVRRALIDAVLEPSQVMTR